MMQLYGVGIHWWRLIAKNEIFDDEILFLLITVDEFRQLQISSAIGFYTDILCSNLIFQSELTQQLRFFEYEMSQIF